MKVILISGKAQSGKDTFAKYAKNYFEQNNKRVLITHFGDLVKYTAKTFFNWNGEKDEKGRSLLQSLGTNDVRKEFPNFWVDYVKSILKIYKDKWDYVLIPDCRFINEITNFEENNWDTISIRIERPNFDNGLTVEQKMHLSETNLDYFNFDYYVYNNGTEEEYSNKVKMFVDFVENFQMNK